MYTIDGLQLLNNESLKCVLIIGYTSVCKFHVVKFVITLSLFLQESLWDTYMALMGLMDAWNFRGFVWSFVELMADLCVIWDLFFLSFGWVFQLGGFASWCSLQPVDYGCLCNWHEMKKMKEKEERERVCGRHWIVLTQYSKWVPSFCAKFWVWVISYGWFSIQTGPKEPKIKSLNLNNR